MREAADGLTDTVKARPTHRAEECGSQGHRIKVASSQGNDACRGRSGVTGRRSAEMSRSALVWVPSIRRTAPTTTMLATATAQNHKKNRCTPPASDRSVGLLSEVEWARVYSGSTFGGQRSRNTVLRGSAEHATFLSKRQRKTARTATRRPWHRPAPQSGLELPIDAVTIDRICVHRWCFFCREFEKCGEVWNAGDGQFAWSG